ncbi:hypothetical protein IPC1174_09975 [Pseudomonas aeruginosa]|jgi:hypothetical protein|uniref:Uncharacterized protein n=1 Tax=Pseudomonas putida TaxID=303 RepID=A0A1X1A6Q3_PSEPU|nr:hypothetical protein CDL16_01670 [Pseudomonas aeruginosa]OFM67275.1 hypothetical protein HMPREF2670_27570 [Pseudomonas sp. HMSC072F09]OFM78811.1 hypothetical protein HMPREF2666_11015 [Pseudomonas sp. HMSC058C05]ORL67568.1 hypothetical protein B7H17_00475 [Pseudomonas putida]KSJ85206.1 hypothetical protein APA02_12185 [Pseudomonas aeruginosa]
MQMTIFEYHRQVALEFFERALVGHLRGQQGRDICTMCVSDFAGDGNNRLCRQVGDRLIVVRLIDSEHPGFSVLDPEDARAIIREQITGLQAAVSIDHEWLKQAVTPR